MDATERREIWGTEVYTDDSDVVAALIHEGWIDPAFPEDVEKTLASLKTMGKDKDSAQGKEKEKPKQPAKPKIPPLKDVLVTLLILPPLASYKGTIRHSLSSRSWAGDGCARHDGMSFMIHDVKVVDMGVAEGGKLGRKKRLQEWECIRKCSDLRGVQDVKGKRAVKV